MRYPLQAKFVLACWFLLTAGAMGLPTARGQEGAGEQPTVATSLDLVPASAAWYVSSQNHEAQWGAFVESKAWQAFLESPVPARMRQALRSGRRQGWDQFGAGNPAAELLKTYDESVGSVPGRMALNVLSQVLEHEVFVFADDDWTLFSAALGKFYSQINTATAASGAVDPGVILDLAVESFADVEIPTLVFGAVLDDPDQVKGVLAMMQYGMGSALESIARSNPELRDAFSVTDDGDYYCMQFVFDETVVPWDELERDADTEWMVDHIRDLIGDKQACLSIGIRGNYLLVALSPSPETLREMGSGDLLRDHEKFQALRDQLDGETLTWVSYHSHESAVQASADLANIVDTLVSTVTTLEASLADDVDLRGLSDALARDARELKEDMLAIIPAPGAWLSYSFLRDDGYESFSWNWGECRYGDGSLPLGVLDHLGERPVLAVVGRDQNSIQQFQISRKWGRRAFDLMAEYIPRNTEDPALRNALPLFFQECRVAFSEMANATSEDALPATDGGAFGLVVDLATRRKQWHEAMPESSEELPIPSLASVVEIRNADQVRRAGGRYLDAAADILEAYRRLPNNNLPASFVIAPPQHETVEGIDVWYYPLPTELGLEPSLAPCAALSPKLLVLSTNREQSLRLMRSAQVAFSAPLSDMRDQPLMGACWYDNTAVVDSVEDWMRYGLQQLKQSGQSLEIDFPDAENRLLCFREAEVVETAEAGLNLLRCFRNVAQTTEVRDGVTLTHTRMHFADTD